MTFLPIVSRELGRTARRSWPHWLRFWAALAMLAVWAVLLSKWSVAGSRGVMMWNVVGPLLMTFCLLGGAFLTSDSLAVEKREGTLGLLFLTDLQGYDVVLGRLVSSAVQSYFIILAVLPVLVLTVLVGGVTGGEFFRLALVLALTLLFSLAMGLAASAMSTGARESAVRALALVLVLTVTGPLLCWLVGFVQPKWAPGFLLWLSPGYGYWAAADTQYAAGQAMSFWMCAGTVFLLAAGAIALACRRIRREREAGVEMEYRARPVVRPRGFRRGLAFKRRKVLLRFNPVFWLGVRDPGPRRTALVVLASLIGLWFVFSEVVFVVRPTTLLFVPNQAMVIALFSGFGVHLVTKTFVALETTRRWSLDRQSGALELLLVTPVSVRDIIEGEEQALRRQLRWPLAVVCVINMGLFFAVASNANAPGYMGWESTLVLAVAGGMFLLAADFHALIWVGMWRGVNSRGPLRAALSTLWRVMGIGWLGLLGALVLAGGAGITAAFGMWFIFCMALDLMLSGNAKRRLEREFRRAASE